MAAPLTALVIGCGKIGGGLNAGPGDRTVLTHALAYRRNPGFVLAACVDPDPAARAQFMQRWEVPLGFASLGEALASSSRFDVASVCVPTAQHATALATLARSAVRGVFAEKPLGGDPLAAATLVQAFGAAGKPLAVNFTRRWDPAIRALRQEILAGAWGAAKAAAGWYMRGVVNNGSHLVDLLQYLLDRALAPAGVMAQRDDGVPGDPTVDAVLRAGDGLVAHLIGGDGRDFALFEAEILFERGSVRIEELGLAIRRRRPAEPGAYPAARTPARGEWAATRYGEAMVHALDDLKSAIERGTPLASDGASALSAIAVCDALRQMAAERRTD